MLYDREQIRGGDDWRRRISYLMHVCDGAAVLLDRRALRSRWVRAEATFLSIRATYDPQFRLVPVAMAVPDMLERRLAEPGWEPAALQHWQFVRNDDPTMLAKVIWAGLTTDGRLPSGPGPVERLADQMAVLLKDAAPKLLHDLAADLGDQIPYDDGTDHHRSALVVARDVITVVV